MSLQNDPRYFPQADVPTDGDYTKNFGKEQLYQAYLPKSANTDLENAAAGAKTPGTGRYTFDPATGQYTWVPIKATDAAIANAAASQFAGTPGISGSGNAGTGIAGIAGSTSNGDPSTGLASMANSVAATLGNLGLVGLSNAIASNVSPNFGNEGRSSLASIAASEGNSGGDSPGTAGGDGTGGAPGPGASTGPSTGGGVGPGGAPGPGPGAGIGTASSGSPSPGSTGTGSGAPAGGVGPTCFVKGVLVTLSNGRQVAIEDVEVGDVVRGQDGDNQVIAFDRPQLIIPDVRDGTLYGFNGGDKFITSEHPVMTKAGWKAIDQDKAKHFEPHLSEVLVGNLVVGDEILMLDGAYLALNSIETYTEQPQQQLYNLMLGGDHTYYVNGLLVHNKSLAAGGLSSLGDYSDGGRLLRGPGDGVSDSIPAVIGRKRPARLADGEFVVPARIVSELGNGSTEAGARKLYAMLDRIQAGRKKSIGKGKIATNSRMDKNLPA